MDLCRVKGPRLGTWNYGDSPLKLVCADWFGCDGFGPRFAGLRVRYVSASNLPMKLSSPSGRPMLSARRKRSKAASSGPALMSAAKPELR